MLKACGQGVNRQRLSARKKGVHLSPEVVREPKSRQDGSVKKVFIHQFIPRVIPAFSTHYFARLSLLLKSYTPFPQPLLIEPLYKRIKER